MGFLDAIPLMDYGGAVAGGGLGADAGAAEAGGMGMSPYLIAAALGLNYLPKLANKLSGDKNMFQTESKRLQAAAQKGVNIPQSLGTGLPTTKGRSPEELVAIEQAKKAKGLFSNEKFAQSRNMADSTPEDWWGYSGWFDKLGNDWLGKFTEDQRYSIVQDAMDKGAINEHHGTIDIDWTKLQDNKDLNPYLTGKVQADFTKQPTTQQTTQQSPANNSQISDFLRKMQSQPVQKSQPVSQVPAIRQGLLNNVMANNSKPIQYPTAPADDFNATMNKIIGGTK